MLPMSKFSLQEVMEHAFDQYSEKVLEQGNSINGNNNNWHLQ